MMSKRNLSNTRSNKRSSSSNTLENYGFTRNIIIKLENCLPSSTTPHVYIRNRLSTPIVIDDSNLDSTSSLIRVQSNRNFAIKQNKHSSSPIKRENDPDVKVISLYLADNCKKLPKEKYCYILHKPNKSLYKCHNCEFTTKSVKDAVLHFINNGSEDLNNSYVKFNEKTFEYECTSCDFTSNHEFDIPRHLKEHVHSITLKCFICSYSVPDESLLKCHLACHKEFHSNGTGSLKCLKCNDELLSMKLLIKHYYKEHGLKRFQCSTCSKTFYYGQDLKIHVKVHSKANWFRCLHCDSEIKYRNSFRQHMQIHMMEMQMKSAEERPISLLKLARSNVNKDSCSNLNKMHVCTFCSFTSLFFKDLREHMKASHTDEKPYFVCDICKKSYWSRRILEKHIQIFHIQQLVKCFQCDYTTRYKKTLIRHIDRHSGKLSQICNICGFQNNDRHSMSVHIHKHSLLKTILCTLCSYKTYNKSHLSRHMKTHSHDLSYFCYLCNYCCVAKDILYKHMIHKHLKYKPYKCHICSNSYIYRASLNTHLAIHSATRQTFSCSICNKKYNGKYYFMKHQSTHSSVNLYACKFCPSKFASSNGLQSHLKIHTGEGRMCCYKCNYSTTHKGNFITHVIQTCVKAKHMKERKMQCFRCGYSTSHRSNFKTHISKKSCK